MEQFKLTNEIFLRLIHSQQAFRRASWDNPDFALRYKPLPGGGHMLCVDAKIWMTYSLTTEDQNATDWTIL